MTVEEFASSACDYCMAFSGSVTSWGRTVRHNLAVGGVPRSAHLAFLAVDVIYDGSSPGEEADHWLAAHRLRRIPEGDHDHIMPLQWPPTV